MPLENEPTCVVVDRSRECQAGSVGGYQDQGPLGSNQTIDKTSKNMRQSRNMDHILPEEKIRAVRRAQVLMEELDTLRPHVISAIREGTLPVSNMLREVYQYAVVHGDVSSVEPISVESVLEDTTDHAVERLTPVDLAGVFKHHGEYKFDSLQNIQKFVTIANKVAASGGLYMTSEASGGFVGRLKVSGGAVGSTIQLRARENGQELTIGLNTRSRCIPPGIQLVRRIHG